MADSFNKKENNKKKVLKRKEKAQKRTERLTDNNKGKGFDSMIAYVDENGQLTSTPPEQRLAEQRMIIKPNTEKTGNNPQDN